MVVKECVMYKNVQIYSQDIEINMTNRNYYFCIRYQILPVYVDMYIFVLDQTVYLQTGG